MIKNYKKGDVLRIIYKNSNKETIDAFGIVLKLYDSNIILGHNFKGITPIDTLSIKTSSIIESKKIIPKEINSLSDLKFVHSKYDQNN